MSENEKKILESLSRTINNMNDFEKGYILGMAESKAYNKEGKHGANEAEENNSDQGSC